MERILDIFAETTYPRKGTEPFVRQLSIFGIGNNLSPQGDGTISLFFSMLLPPFETTYPRKGTEPANQWHTVALVIETTYPRKGTEQWSFLSCFSPQGNNLSPQGDGNCNVMYFWNNSFAKQLIPARGRKLFKEIERRRVIRKQLIPARGRKPISFMIPAKSIRNNLSPQGDGNRQSHGAPLCSVLKQLIPARGRKPRVRPGLRYNAGKQLIPAGDGND